MAFSLSSIHYRLSDRNDTPEPHWVALLLKKGSVPLTYNPKPAGKYHSELDYRFWLGNLKKKVADLRKLVAGWQDIEFW
jgi:hypothetical protein